VIDLIMNFQNWWAMMGVIFFKKRSICCRFWRLALLWDLIWGEKRRERSNEVRDGFLSSWGGR
jgi:hypothetical protein